MTAHAVPRTNRIGPASLLLAVAMLAAALAAPALRAEPIDFELPVLGADAARLSDWRGQWVVVNYWATWCAPCRKEIPDFSAMHDARDDITVLGLAFEDTEVEAFEAFLQDYPASYPILLVDVYAPPESLGAPRALPTTYLVDPAGEVVETWLGPITSETITERIDTGPERTDTGED